MAQRGVTIKRGLVKVKAKDKAIQKQQCKEEQELIKLFPFRRLPDGVQPKIPQKTATNAWLTNQNLDCSINPYHPYEYCLADEQTPWPLCPRQETPATSSTTFTPPLTRTLSCPQLWRPSRDDVLNTQFTRKDSFYPPLRPLPSPIPYPPYPTPLVPPMSQSDTLSTPPSCDYDYHDNSDDDSTEQEQISLEQDQPKPNQQEKPLPQVTSLQHQQNPKENQEEMPKHQEGTPKHQEENPNHQEDMPKHQEGTPKHQEETPNHQEEIMTNQQQENSNEQSEPPRVVSLPWWLKNLRLKTRLQENLNQQQENPNQQKETPNHLEEKPNQNPLP